jgi:4-diphosphocytidyl-2-C-methyl-D-erythritol kinase
MILKAYAKLNLSLDITGKRPDGYHELDTIMQSISLYDTVTITRADSLRVTIDTGDVDEMNNTAYAAANAFFAHTGVFGAHIAITKRIPQQSGLGGASADAAAVLIGLNRLYETHLDSDTLMRLGRSVGADVPFALFGGTARARGIGEKLERLHIPQDIAFVVITPRTGVSTAAAFARYRPGAPMRMDTVTYALQKGDIALYHQHAGNALGMSALSIAPDIMKAAAALRSAGCIPALMTGSGSSVFAVYPTKEDAITACNNVRGDYALCDVFHPVRTGIEIEEA